MITKMKKLTFLVYHKEYESFLTRIRELGVVHIVEKYQDEMDENLQSIVQKRLLCNNILHRMYALSGKKPDETVHKDWTVDALVEEYERLQNRIQELNQQLPLVDREIEQMEVWGDFDWESVRRLEKNGWNIRFYTCQDKSFNPQWIDLYDAVVVKEEGGQIFFVVVAREEVTLDVEPLRLPDLNLSDLQDKRKKIVRALAEAEMQLECFCKEQYRTLEEGISRLESEIDWLKVDLNSERKAEGTVVLLEGWVPEDSEAEVKQMLEEAGVYYEMRAASKTDNAPIKLKNNAFVRMYETLTKMYGMPDYAEFDPTPILAPFFSLFFAFCMGDAGYGLALIALGFLLKKKLSASMRGMMNLVITLGVFTTVVGAILGTFFGVSLVEVDTPQWMREFMIVGKIGETTYDKQMLLALIIGVVHISLAMTVKAIGETVRFGFKESLSSWGWLLLVVGFVSVGSLSFFKLIPENVSLWAFVAIGGVSAIGIYLLNDIHRNVFINIGAGLWDTYNMATGLMGDVLSYIRLYALGLAGGMLGGVFNQLAFMVNDAAGPALGWLFCGLILVFGHTLNIAMSCLSAFVHPLRLTFVEYFKNSGYDGKGEAYKPFTVVKK